MKDEKTRQYSAAGARESLEGPRLTNTKTRQYKAAEPESPLRPEIDRRKDQTIPGSWSQRVPGGPKLTDEKTQTIHDSWSQRVP